MKDRALSHSLPPHLTFSHSTHSSSLRPGCQERGHHTSFLRDSVIFSLTSFASPESFWVLRKGTEGLGPNGKEKTLEGGHCHWVEGTLPARPWPGAWSWEASQRFIFCFFLLGFPVSEVVAEGSWGLPGLYK